MTPSPVVGAEVGEAIRAAVPPWLVPVFVLITHLGNPAFFLVVFSLDYWFADRDRGAHALGVAIAGIGLVVALKTFFDAPRPPASFRLIPISGYSFPSGHATASTIGYGILAYDLTFGGRRSRYALAGAVVVLVALSRVVLGVHYVRDVVAGVLVGLLFLVATIRLTGHRPRPGLGLAVALGAAALVVSGASHDGVAVFGAALGGAVTWDYLDAVPTLESIRSKRVLLAAVLPVFVALGYAGTELDVPTVAVFVANAALAAGILAVPEVVE